MGDDTNSDGRPGRVGLPPRGTSGIERCTELPRLDKSVKYDISHRHREKSVLAKNLVSRFLGQCVRDVPNID